MDEERDHRAAWDARYEANESLWGLEPNQFVVRHAGSLPPGRVLDLGCGQGRNAVWLAGKRHHVTAVDLSEVAIAQATRYARQAGVDVEFIAADLTAYEPDPGAYDLVLLSYLQLPEADRRAVHAAAKRALAPGGTVLLVAHHLDNLQHGVGGPPSPDVLFTEDDLAEDFGDLHIDINDKVLRHVDIDGVHGDAIDVLLVARKIST